MLGTGSKYFSNIGVTRPDQFGGIRDGIKLFIFGICADYNISLQRGFGVRNTLNELDEVQPVIQVVTR